MTDEKEKKPLCPETFFLPPLKMVLAFFDRDAQQARQEEQAENQEKAKEKDLEKLIEKLSEKEE